MTSQTEREAQSLKRLIAELVVVRASGHLGDHQRRYPIWELDNRHLQDLLAAGVGGVILLGGSAAELALRTRQLQDWAGQALLLCADVEEGVGQRFEGASWLPPPPGARSALWTRSTEGVGAGRTLRRLHWQGCPRSGTELGARAGV